MLKKDVTIQLDKGLEARPVAVLVQIASQYDSKVYLEADNKKVNAKSIMGMMSLGMNTGEIVTVITDGSDEDMAMNKIEQFLEGKAVS